MFPTLYSRDKHGHLITWSVSVENSTIVKKHGRTDGKIQEVHKTIDKGKNIGRSNETTPHEQAVSEARSAWNKCVDKGYMETQPGANDVKILPMLANKWLPKRATDTMYAQPKLDGVRLLIGKRNGVVEAMTRTGKKVNNADHIIAEMGHRLEEGDFWDGECYLHNMPFQELSGAFRRAGAGQELEFWVFDMFNLNDLTVPFETRFKPKKPSGKVRFVETYKITPAQIKKTHEKFSSQGYEGTILRLPSFKYELGKRSTGLFKFKDFEDDEFEIVGFGEATGNDKGTVIWRCACIGGEFNVRPRGTREQRRAWFAEGKSTIGKKLTVRYQGVSEEGVPRFPVGIQIRDYE
jgi:ATP-dependent DNA ligase